MEKDDTLLDKVHHFVCSTKTVHHLFQGSLVAVSFACYDSVLLMSFSGYCTLLSVRIWSTLAGYLTIIPRARMGY